MDLGLKDRVAVITGCSVGIGRGVAKELAAEGAQTVVIARRLQLLEELADEIERDGGLRPMVLAYDLYQPESAERIRADVLARFGHVDILVNNAGGSRPITADTPVSTWDSAYALNFTAIRRLTEEFLPGMKERKFGRIFTVGGTAEPAGVNATSIAKAATTTWAKGLSREVGPYGITVNCVAPGKIHSEQIARNYPPDVKAEVTRRIPVGYFGDPPDIAALIAFLSSPRARYITGQRIDVDGGLRLSIW